MHCLLLSLQDMQKLGYRSPEEEPRTGVRILALSRFLRQWDFRRSRTSVKRLLLEHL